MTRVAPAPADTRMMAVVHDALRRDLARARAALADPVPPAQRIAIARHVEWLTGFLHRHHEGEDAGLWPLVRSRDPGIVDTVDHLEADHRLVAPALAACAAAARAAVASDDARDDLAVALQRLSEVLLPHLEREEAVMPRVSVLISDAEWKAIDEEHYLSHKSVAELGFEGHWLIDGLDAERTGVVLHQVGPVVRVVLVHGFARRYHRHATACWGAAGPDAYRPVGTLPRRVGTSGRTEALVEAGPDALWEVVADVTRTPEWSRECRRVEWLDGATAVAPGVRFRGENRAGPLRWRRTNRVVTVDPGRRLVWRTVPTLLYPDSSEWRIELEPEATGTRVVQSFEVVRATRLLSYVYSLLVPSHRGRDSELDDDLHRLGRVASSPSARPHRFADRSD